jgi:hypothetical protein
VSSLYKEEISFLATRGIITGYAGNIFKPDQPTKRLEAILMLLREKGITDLTAPDPGFVDLKKGDLGYKEIAKAVELGIISGKFNKVTGQKYFEPNGTLTRGQLAKILTIAYEIKGNTESKFDDVSLNDWYFEYVNTLVANGIVNGFLDNTFRPNLEVSRKNFAVLFARYLNPEFRNR